MSLKKFICLCLVVVTGSFGALAAPQAMAQAGHAIGQAAPLTPADMNEIKALVKTTLLPAMMTMQQAITVMSLDPEEACRLGKTTDDTLLEMRRGLVAIRDRVKSEGKDTSQIENLILKADAMMTPDKRPSVIFCNPELKPEKLSPEDRAMMTKVTGYISEYTKLMILGLQAAMDNNSPAACSYLTQSRTKLLELDQYITSLRTTKLAAHEDITQYDQLLIANANNRRQLERLMTQVCPAS